MQPSHIQVKAMRYRRIIVTPRELNKNEEFPKEPFDFNDVMIGNQTVWSKIVNDDGKENPLLYKVHLGIVIDNKGGKLAPYNIDIQIEGLFEINEIVSEEKLEKVLLANGLGILYGAIREQVLALTTRSLYGKLLLPTVNFLDVADKENKLVKKKK